MASNRARSLQVIDPFLSGVARRYKSDGFIADLLLPRIPVRKLAGQYPIFAEQYWFANDVDNKSADRQPAKEIDFEWSLDTFLCEEYKLKVSLTELEDSQAEPELRLRQSKAEFLAHRMNLAYEHRVAALLDTIDNGGQLDNAMDATPSTNWDQATATIEADIKGGVTGVYDEIGRPPNVLVIPYKVAYAAAVQEDIRAIIAYEIQGGNGDSLLRLGSRVLPPVIHGMRVVIPMGQTTTAKEGATSITKTEIWGDEVRLLYVDPSAKWGEPSVAYNLAHTPRTVTRWRDVDPDVEYIRELERQDEKVVAPKAGYVLRDVLS